MGGRPCASLAGIQTQVMQAQVSTACAGLLLVGELVHRVVQDLVVRDSAHPQAVVADVVLLLVTPCVLRVAHLVDRHLLLRAASGAARLLAVTFVAMSIVSVPLMPVVPVTSVSMPVHRTRSMRLAAASAVASMATVPSDDVHAEVEPVTAVRIRPRVRVAVMSVVSNDALDSLVGLLGRLAVARSVSSCSRGPSRKPKTVDSMMKAAHRSMRRENMGLPPSNL